jgi:heavy metal sensor kinase
MRIESVRGRLAAYFVAALAVALLIVGGLIYALLARALYTRIDDHLHVLADITATSLSNDLAEGQDVPDAARSTAAELASRQQMLAIYDGEGRWLADAGRDRDLAIVLPPLDSIPSEDVLLRTVAERGDRGDRHRLGIRRVSIPSHGAAFVIVAGTPLEPADDELESLREILAYLVPVALLLAGVGGWFLARQSLSPVTAMVERARDMSAGTVGGRLPVGNPRDELGVLASTFNDLLGRLDAALTQQRDFMADASHELRTPVATMRTAANVALQQPRRDEAEYRQTLALVEQQAARLSRIVEDMFTLARADAGTYPLRRAPMYLDEVADDVVRAARVLAAEAGVAIDLSAPESAAFTGDEELVRRLLGNLLDNAIRHAPAASTVSVVLARAGDGFTISVRDRGPGIAPEIASRIFDRFYRGDAGRRGQPSDGGAGLGLALVRWIARAHGGEVTLAESSPDGTVFTVVLPQAG